MSFLNKKNVLLAGGTGLIGTPLLGMLLNGGASVRVVSLDASKQENRPNLERIDGDLTRLETCLSATKDMDYVFNLASPKGSSNYALTCPNSFYVSNILINTHLLESARVNKVDRFLYTSTIHVNAEPKAENWAYQESDASIENGWGGPPAISDHKYALWAKRMGELHADACAKQYGWDKICIVRPTVVYGPGDNFSEDSALLIPSIIRKSVLNIPMNLLSKYAGRDFLYCDDAAAGMVCAMEHYCNCRPINLGSGVLCTISDILNITEKYLGRSIPVTYKDESQKPNYKLLNTTVAKSIGFHPAVPIVDGIHQTIDWFIKNRSLNG